MRAHHAALALGATLWGCTLAPVSVVDKACDETHPCPLGFSCSVSRCVPASRKPFASQAANTTAPTSGV